MSRIADLFRPIVAAIAAPLERRVRRQALRSGRADLELARQLDAAGLADSAAKLRRHANALIHQAGEERR